MQVWKLTGGNYDTVKRALQRLYEGAKINRIPPGHLTGLKAGNNHIVYFNRSKSGQIPSPSHIKHELGVSECFCAFYAEVTRFNLSLDWKRRPSMPAIFVPEISGDDSKVPDLKLEIQGQLLLLEFETGENDLVRSDWHQTSFQGKVWYYSALHEDVLKKRYPPFRLLTVCLDREDADKRRGLVFRILGRKGANLFWFTTLNQLTQPEAALLAHIWKVPTSEEPRPLFEI